MKTFKQKRVLPYFVFFLVMAALLVSLTIKAEGAVLGCTSSATLEDLINCIEAQMPHQDEGYTAPTSTQMVDLRNVIQQMLNGQTNITLPTSLVGIMEVKNFTDSQNGLTYTVLMETGDANNDGIIDKGFGTFIVYNGAVRELNHAIPHVYTDIDTEDEGISLFKGSGSRSFMMAGTTRNAVNQTSSCNVNYEVADVGHNVNNMFFNATQELMEYYGGDTWYQIQWHGFASNSCNKTDVFISHGDYLVTPPAGDIVYTFKSNVLKYNPSWLVTLDGASCDYDGWSNTSGRILNGVPVNDVCDTPATSISGKFIHIEQEPSYRQASNWINAVNDTFVPGGTVNPPAAPTGLTATAGRRKITLNWNASAGAASYNVKRSSVSGGPYNVIATGVTATTYVNSSLTQGATYYYVVSAVNSAGESGNSNQASATVK